MKKDNRMSTTQHWEWLIKGKGGGKVLYGSHKVSISSVCFKWYLEAI